MVKPSLIFHVIGFKAVGLGHIYRSLSLAEDLSDFQISFACTKSSFEMAELMIKEKYYLHLFDEETIYSDIKNLSPDIVINDVLSTNEDDIKTLKASDIKVINFEDLGTGSIHADLTINELYEKPTDSRENMIWGHNYFFLRDEFMERAPNNLSEKIENILITFGGTDSNNLTKYSLDSVVDYCNERGIFIYIVSGPGYQHFSDLENIVSEIKNVSLTHATGVISEIMQKVQIALTSNGRTVYELAHMHIPSIVVSQHKRESEHKFSSLENGMVNIGIFSEKNTQPLLKKTFKKMVEDEDYFKMLYKNSSRFDFSENKSRVINLIKNI